MKVHRRLRWPIITFFSFIVPTHLSAQPGIAEFYQASSEVNRWYDSLGDLAFAIGAVSGLLGGLRIYSNWQAGKHHIDAQVMGWFFSCLFLSIIGASIKLLFGVR